jgi:hypothetical protein
MAVRERKDGGLCRKRHQSGLYRPRRRGRQARGAAAGCLSTGALLKLVMPAKATLAPPTRILIPTPACAKPKRVLSIYTELRLRQARRHH